MMADRCPHERTIRRMFFYEGLAYAYDYCNICGNLAIAIRCPSFIAMEADA